MIEVDECGHSSDGDAVCFVESGVFGRGTA